MLKRGFTLIELLVILAIFGILVAVVVVFAKGAIIRGKNKAIASDVSQIRSIAQRIYLENTDGYKGLCADSSDSLNVANLDLFDLQEDIEDLGGAIRKCYSDETSYCLTVNLFQEKGFLCIDDEGRFSYLLPGDPEPCQDAQSMCP